MSRDLTAFDLLMRANQVTLPNVWQVAFAEAEEQLLAVCSEGVDVLDICRAAWDCLPAEAREEALDVLFYGWWESEQDRKARTAQAGGQR